MPPGTYNAASVACAWSPLDPELFQASDKSLQLSLASSPVNCASGVDETPAHHFGEITMTKPVCVVWTDDATLYRNALSRVGLEDRFELHCFERSAAIPDDIAARTEILVGWRHGGYLQRMPRLRWIQTMTSGVEAWLSAP